MNDKQMDGKRMDRDLQDVKASQLLRMRNDLGAWRALLLAGVMSSLASSVLAQDKPVYRCPGNLYTDSLSAKEASDRGCKTLEGAPITVIQSVAPREKPVVRSSASGSSGEKVSSEDQKARDSDAKRILEAELRKEEEALANLQKEYNNGQPERRGDEKNAQKYLDRIAEMKAALTRKESDVAALRRELGNK